MARQVDERELRQLNAALGLGGAGAHAGRLALIVAVALAALALLVVLAFPIGQPTTHYGSVTALGFAETDEGSRPYAVVRIDGREVRVRLMRRGLCRVGDRIAVRRQPTLFGGHHRVALEGCTRRGRSA